MDDSRISLLRHLIDSPSASGFEQPVQQVIREEVKHYTDTVETDIHGNVIAAIQSDSPLKVMLTAHCDEIGFLIRYIDSDGFLYFAKVGGFDPSTLPGNRVQISTPNGLVSGVIGRKPVHQLSDEERNRAPKINDMWIDIGAANKEEAQRLVPLGSPATRANQLETLQGDLIVSRALDDKAGIFTLLETMRRIYAQREKLATNVYFVSAVQEEVGSRGIQTSAFNLQPHIAIAVDVTYTSDHPGTSKSEIGEVKLNGGPVVTIGGFVNSRVYNLLVKAAEEAGIAWQVDTQAANTFTDTDMIQVARGGVATGLVSIPCRYLHTASEIASLRDIEQTAELLARFILALTKDVNVIP